MEDYNDRDTMRQHHWDLGYLQDDEVRSQKSLLVSYETSCLEATLCLPWSMTELTPASALLVDET